MRDSDDGPQMWKGMRRGAGWAIGVGSVISLAGLLRDGPRPAIKSAMKTGMRGREAAAELAEQVQDLYAEAQSERVTDAAAADGAAAGI